MLASLLPGLRDLRTPLAAGYLWIVALWLLLHDRVPKSTHEATGPIQSLYELGELLGASALLAALSFVAYLLGSLLVVRQGPRFSAYILDPDEAGRFTPGFLRKRRRAVRTYGYSGALVLSLGQSMYRQLATFVSTRLRETAQHLPEDDHLYVLRRATMVTTTLLQGYIQEAISDLQAVGIQLQAKNRDFWDTYDRQAAEAQFRFAIAPPIATIIGLVAWQSRNFAWLLLLAVPLYLLVLGVRQAALATSTLVQAVVLKMVEPPVLERLQEVVARLKDTGQGVNIFTGDHPSDTTSRQPAPGDVIEPGGRSPLP